MSSYGAVPEQPEQVQLARVAENAIPRATTQPTAQKMASPTSITRFAARDFRGGRVMVGVVAAAAVTMEECGWVRRGGAGA